MTHFGFTCKLVKMTRCVAAVLSWTSFTLSAQLLLGSEPVQFQMDVTPGLPIRHTTFTHFSGPFPILP